MKNLDFSLFVLATLAAVFIGILAAVNLFTGNFLWFFMDVMLAGLNAYNAHGSYRLWQRNKQLAAAIESHETKTLG